MMTRIYTMYLVYTIRAREKEERRWPNPKKWGSGIASFLVLCWAKHLQIVYHDMAAECIYNLSLLTR